MTTQSRRSQRRTDALTRERIVEAAVELLDTTGEDGLTFKALTRHLATGAGAIYWHVASKDELLGAATEAIIGTALALPAAKPDRDPQEEIRAIALRLFDAIETRPWLATQLAVQFARNPWGSVTRRIFERIGQQISALGVPRSAWFDTTSALVHYILGATGQNAINGTNVHPHLDRREFLDSVALAWAEVDPDDHPFTSAIGDQLRDHDDREQFLAGVDLVLTGIITRHPPRNPSG